MTSITSQSLELANQGRPLSAEVVFWGARPGNSPTLQLGFLQTTLESCAVLMAIRNLALLTWDLQCLAGSGSLGSGVRASPGPLTAHWTPGASWARVGGPEWQMGEARGPVLCCPRFWGEGRQ